MTEISRTERVVDDLDRAILQQLRMEARVTIKELARRLDRRRATIHNCITKLEEDGVIKGYTVIPDFKALDHGITVYVLVTLTATEYTEASALPEVGRKLSVIPYVTEVQAISGDYDYLLKARVPSLDLLGTEINFRLRQMSGVGRTLTLAAFDTTLEELGSHPLYQLR